LLEVAKKVKNISAKHEGGDIEVEQASDHPSDILEYFMSKQSVIDLGLWDALERNYLDKHDAVNRTARALTEYGISLIAARKLHHRS
jgi:hypothetical protein